MTQHLDRRGSLVVVLWVALILGILGTSAATLSSGMNRRDFHQNLRENALEVAKSAAEEAALLINNGKVTISLDDTALEELRPVEIPTSMSTGATQARMGIPEDAVPRVLVQAAVIGPDAYQKKPPLEQLEEIVKEIETKGYDPKGYDPKEYERQKRFWDSVGADGLREGDPDRNQVTRTSDFWNWSKNVGIERWIFRSKSGDERTPRGSAGGGAPQGLQSVAELFYEDVQTATHRIRLEKRPTFSPSFLDELRDRWTRAMRIVGRDAATRMASCGSNPNLAMAHLVGDLRTGALISSDTEVNITSAFMRSRELGANKTYLLEISSGLNYSGAKGMDGQAYFTTYRLFQKTEWERILENMTASLVESLRDHGIRVHELSELFPPEADEPGRKQRIGNSGNYFDPKKVLEDHIYAELPSTAGSKMYPYPLATTYGRGLFEEVDLDEVEVAEVIEVDPDDALIDDESQEALDEAAGRDRSLDPAFLGAGEATPQAGSGSAREAGGEL